MAVHGSDPTRPCKTMIWNVCTFITALMAVQDSRRIDAALLALPLSIKSFLKHKGAKLPETDKRGEQVHLIESLIYMQLVKYTVEIENQLGDIRKSLITFLHPRQNYV